MLYGDAAFAAIDDADPNRRARRSAAPPRPRPPPRDQTAQRARSPRCGRRSAHADELPPRVRLIPPRPPADDEDDQPLQDDGIPGVADAPPAAPAPHRVDLLTEVLSIPDIQFVVAHFLLSRAELVRLRCASRTLRRLVDGSAALGYLGLFRTPFGAEHGCRLQPIPAAQPPAYGGGRESGRVAVWRAARRRLADDPGLGKTVTVLALVVRARRRRRAIPGAQFGAQFSDAQTLCSAQVHSAGAFPSMPAEFWNTEGGWIQLRTNPVGHRSSSASSTRSRASSTRRRTRTASRAATSRRTSTPSDCATSKSGSARCSPSPIPAATLSCESFRRSTRFRARSMA